MACLFVGMTIGNAYADESPVPCKTIDDCWLSASGAAIKRPRKLRGRALPQGDCGAKLHWLRHRLTCEANVCTAKNIGDKC